VTHGGYIFFLALLLFALTQKVAKKSRLQKNGEKLHARLVAAELAPRLHLVEQFRGLGQRRLPFSRCEKDSLACNFFNRHFSEAD
jgi:hypothetical protein